MTDPDIKSRILSAATTLFARQGYGSTSVREVVEAAGVTKPTLYYYFDGKEALFREVIGAKLADGEAMMARALALDLPVVERLRRLMKDWIHAARADIDGLRLVMTCSLPDAHGQPEVDVIGRHLRALEPLAQLVALGQSRGELRADLDPRVAVMVLAGALDVQIYSILFGLDVPDDVVDAIFDTWLYGVSP
jgi:TetR/AcrR family transcriptional regulator